MKWNFFKRNWKDNLEWSENDFQENEEPISKNKENSSVGEKPKRKESKVVLESLSPAYQRLSDTTIEELLCENERFVTELFR
jgi:hypothetical protein